VSTRSSRREADGPLGLKPTCQAHGSAECSIRTAIRFSTGRALSYLPEGVHANLVAFSDRREVYDISTTSDSAGKPLIFARAWYPGYSVRLNGQQLELRLIGDILLAVTLPLGASGRLTVDYIPAGFVLGCWLAGVSLFGLCLLEIRRLWRKENA
jgi:hypothetical protein